MKNILWTNQYKTTPKLWSLSWCSLSGCSFLGRWVSRYLRIRSSYVSLTLGGPPGFPTSTFGGLLQERSKGREELLSSFSALDSRELPSRR